MCDFLFCITKRIGPGLREAHSSGRVEASDTTWGRCNPGRGGGGHRLSGIGKENGGGGGGCWRPGSAARAGAPQPCPRPGAAWRCSACLAEGARVPLCASQRLSLRSTHQRSEAAAGRSGTRSHRRRHRPAVRKRPDTEGNHGKRVEGDGPCPAEFQEQSHFVLPCPDRRLLSSSDLSTAKVELILEGGIVLQGGHPRRCRCPLGPRSLGAYSCGVMQCFGRNTALPFWGLSSPRSRLRKAKRAVMQQNIPWLPQSLPAIPSADKTASKSGFAKVMSYLGHPMHHDVPCSVSTELQAGRALPVRPHVAFCLNQPKKLCSSEKTGHGGCNLLGFA
ncbi:uncharacterized protein LOC129212426 [Grus americana]|uniref:uncharacterized protein LOC129212426 n=1 Tax=Grus americana TaxID=9117 RepID=UPI0024088606|nr:uncharacterized protein LOC129212426 [Grus americana]